MKVRYQDALRNPTGWLECEASEWARLPKRHVPDRRERGGRDDAPGWIRNVNVQGVTTEGYDHVAIAPHLVGNDEGVRMVVWNDDADDLGPGERVAIVATILPLAPDPHLGMAINTRQSFIRFCEGDRYERFMAQGAPQNTTIRPWAEFERPPEELTRHGVWLADDKFLEHLDRAPQSEWGWMHWCDHLPDSECEIETERTHERQRFSLARPRRVLREQRAQGRYHQAARTITYYQRDTNRAQGWVAASHEDALETTTAASATESVTTNAAEVICFAHATPEGAPNSADWPNGDYHSQVNCAAASTGLLYGNGATTQNGMVRLTDLNTFAQGTSPNTGSGDFNDFSGTGLKLSTATWDPTAGVASDLFAIMTSATGDSHGDAITLTLNTTDSYADGPWTAAAPVSRAFFQRKWTRWSRRG